MEKLIVFMGESGTGKTTLKERFAQETNATEVVTYTTRPIRPGEIPNKTYHYISKQVFAMMALDNEFAEYTYYKTIAGTWYYGTSLDSLTGDGIKVAVLNPEGVRALKKKGIPMNVVYIKCSGKTLQQRLENRGDDPREIKRRLEAEIGRAHV